MFIHKLLVLFMIFSLPCCATGTMDRLLMVRGELVNEIGLPQQDCTLFLKEISAKKDYYFSDREVGGKFRADFTSWAPNQSELEIKIKCIGKTYEFISRLIKIEKIEYPGINIGRIEFHH